MIEKIKHMIFNFSRVAGVEANLGTDGKIEFNLILLSKKKNLITIEIKENAIDDFEKLKSYIPSETPVAISVNGRGVLLKKISDPSITSEAELISQVLPNAKDTDFYIQKNYSGKNLFVSVIRKDNFKKIADLFAAHQLPLIYASCGPFIAADLIPFLKEEVDEVVLNNLKLLIRNKSIADYKPDTGNADYILEVGEDKIPSSLIPAYACAFHLFLSASAIDGLPSEQIKILGEDFKNKNIFKIGGYSALAFFVGLMLLNYLVYNYYKSQNNELSGKSTAYEGMVKEIETLEKQVKEKEYFLQSAGWLSSPKTSFFADQIAASIPASIKLKDLKINPLNNKISKKARKQIFQSDTIYIAGTCSSPTVLNPWMRALKNEQWIKEANNINYTHDPKTRTGYFEVEIQVNDEF